MNSLRHIASFGLSIGTTHRQSMVSFVLSFLLIWSCVGHAQPPEYQFVITAEDAEYLHYLDYQNRFSYSAVEYRFGEVRVTSPTLSLRVNIAPWNTTQLTIQGIADQGDNTNLLEFSRTDIFTLPDDEPVTIDFYRRIGLWAPTLAFPPEPGDPPGTPGTTPWDVLDKSEWELRLLKASDGSLIKTLDLVGVDAHDDHYADAYYGTNPDRVKHSLAIPAAYAGSEVYIQVIPRRWGPSPYGLSLMRKASGMVNHSAVEDQYGNPLPEHQIASILDQWFNAVMEYCANYKQSTGTLPDHNHWSFGRDQMDVFLSSFFTQVGGQANGVYEENPPAEPKQGAAIQTIIQAPAMFLREVSPNPVSGETIDIAVKGHAEKPVIIALHTVDGRELGLLWQGRTGRGDKSIRVDLPELAAGTYIITLKNVNGERYGSKQITVVR